MPYYVVEGHSITSKRGVIGCDDPNPEVTPACIGGDPETAQVRLAELANLGILVEAAKSPWHTAEDSENEVYAKRSATTAPPSRKGRDKAAKPAESADPLARASKAAKGKGGKGGATRAGSGA